MRPADPRTCAGQAALFFVPVMVMQMAGNLWHPYQFLTETVHLLRHNYPYWNRSQVPRPTRARACALLVRGSAQHASAGGGAWQRRL